MRRILRKGAREFELFGWQDARFHEFGDLFSAREFLEQFLEDPLAMAVLRDLLEQERGFGDARLDDRRVIEALAPLLVSGRVKVLGRYDTLQPTTFLAEMPEPVSRPTTPVQDEEAVEEEEEPPESFFPVAEAQAAALAEAAQSGAPLCEA